MRIVANRQLYQLPSSRARRPLFCAAASGVCITDRIAAYRITHSGSPGPHCITFACLQRAAISGRITCISRGAVLQFNGATTFPQSVLLRISLLRRPAHHRHQQHQPHQPHQHHQPHGSHQSSAICTLLPFLLLLMHQICIGASQSSRRRLQIPFFSLHLSSLVEAHPDALQL